MIITVYESSFVPGDCRLWHIKLDGIEIACGLPSEKKARSSARQLLNIPRSIRLKWTRASPRESTAHYRRKDGR